ncbi:hypothetical protein [Acidicapsa ligni]|uniref:hypothetical protein n=1 Tax=Acidicapsa ligni TaxID=542300 RepID=UPI0021E0EDBD|nr:hypothetical protein [Acidicapsa ligni]
MDVYYNGEIAVTPALTESDAAVLRAATHLERTDATKEFFAAVAASPEPDLPYHAGLLEISEDREFIYPEEDESRHGFRVWLRLVIEHYLAPRGYVLNGEVTWEGEDRDDSGTIFVKENEVEAVDDLIFNAGPSWAPNNFADDHLKQAVRDLVDSADNTGCSPDLTVISSVFLENLRSRMPEF